MLETEKMAITYRIVPFVYTELKNYNKLEIISNNRTHL